MSSSTTSNSLVSANDAQQAFSQQGSLDWVALGRTQYSMSIAILGRLAKAGIDTLTVAFGQAMCLQIPIGPHGEKVLAESMNGLTAKSCASELLWFGVGVRHILRELVQTSQGCSLIALCAALTESHSISVSALVLYEIAKECGGPRELAPSLEQWEALIRVAASVFNGSTLGPRISQIAILGAKIDRSIRVAPNSPTSHPVDLAKVLLAIGQVVHGNIQSVTVSGDSCCSWIAAWADFVLGLRVLVRHSAGHVVYANYNVEQTFAQVNVHFSADADNSGSLQIRSGHFIRSGMEFVQKCFGRHRLAATFGADVFFCAGRLQWDTMFFEMFHVQVRLLLRQEDILPTLPFGKSEAKTPDPSLNLKPNILAPKQIFSRLVAIATIVLVVMGNSDVVSGGALHYYVRACEHVPELRQSMERTRHAITTFLGLYGSEDSLLDIPVHSEITGIQHLIIEYTQYFDLLGKLCRCSRHHNVGGLRDVNPDQFCFPQMAETIIYTMSLLDRIVLDAPLRPTTYGLYHLYQTSTYHLTQLESGEVNEPEIPEYPVSFFLHITRSIDSSCGAAFSAAAALFSGEDWSFELHGSIAKSDGKIYCYTQLLEGLTDNFQEARKIHVGSGHIEYRTRLQKVLYDTNGRSEPQFGYPARETAVVDSIDHLNFDSTSNPIQAQLVIEEEPTHLFLRHHINTQHGDILIAPTVFFERLQKANSYKFAERYPTWQSKEWEAVLRGYKYIVVHGEGRVDASDKCHLLRPLSGNVLGRCVAMSTTTNPIALVRTDDELQIFARFWARRLVHYVSTLGTSDYYALIS